MQNREVFKIIDADTNVTATIFDGTDGDEDTIMLSRGGGYTDLVSLSLSDFRRMVAAVERQY